MRETPDMAADVIWLMVLTLHSEVAALHSTFGHCKQRAKGVWRCMGHGHADKTLPQEGDDAGSAAPNGKLFGSCGVFRLREGVEADARSMHGEMQ